MSRTRIPLVIISLLFLLLSACTASGNKEKPGHGTKIASPANSANAAITAPWSCPDTGWQFTTTKPLGKKGESWGIQPWREGSPDEDRKGYETIFWTGDLNGDGTLDLITGENPQAPSHTAVLIGCGGGRYYQAMHEITESIAVVDSQDTANGWKRLRVEFWPYGLDYGQRILYGWQGERYGKCCQFQVHIDSTATHDRLCCP